MQPGGQAYFRLTHPACTQKRDAALMMQIAVLFLQLGCRRFSIATMLLPPHPHPTGRSYSPACRLSQARMPGSSLMKILRASPGRMAVARAFSACSSFVGGEGWMWRGCQMKQDLLRQPRREGNGQRL